MYCLADMPGARDLTSSSRTFQSTRLLSTPGDAQNTEIAFLLAAEKGGSGGSTRGKDGRGRVRSDDGNDGDRHWGVHCHEAGHDALKQERVKHQQKNRPTKAGIPPSRYPRRPRDLSETTNAAIL